MALGLGVKQGVNRRNWNYAVQANFKQGHGRRLDDRVDPSAQCFFNEPVIYARDYFKRATGERTIGP